jgi:hypothetical protein
MLPKPLRPTRTRLRPSCGKAIPHGSPISCIIPLRVKGAGTDSTTANRLKARVSIRAVASSFNFGAIKGDDRSRGMPIWY